MMKKILIVVSVLALGACSESAPETEPATEVDATEDAGVDMSAWVGGYSLVYGDGTEATMTIAADGTYSGMSGEETVTGDITLGDGGAFCYTPEGTEDTECWTNGEANEDGSWASTSDAGRTATVSRIEETGGAEPAA